MKEEASAVLVEVFASEAGRVGDPERGEWVAVVVSEDARVRQSAATALAELGIGWYQGSRRDEADDRSSDVMTIYGRENLVRLWKQVGRRLSDPEKRRRLEALATGPHWQRAEAPPELGELILAKKREGLADKQIAEWLIRWGEPPLAGRKEWSLTAVREIRREAAAEARLRFVREAISGAWSTPERERAAAYLAAVLDGQAGRIAVDSVVITNAEAEQAELVPRAFERLGIGYRRERNESASTTGFTVRRADIVCLAAAAGSGISSAAKRQLLLELALDALWGPYRVPGKVVARMQLRTDEGMSAADLASKMNEAKIPAAGGSKEWSTAMVKNALRAAEIETKLTTALA